MLSALLATYQLLPALESGASGGAKQPGAPTWRVVLTYWRKRALRIVPAYAVANLLALALFRPTSGEVPSLAGQARSLKYSGCPASLWANALFLTNSLSTPETCGAPVPGGQPPTATSGQSSSLKDLGQALRAATRCRRRRRCRREPPVDHICAGPLLPGLAPAAVRAAATRPRLPRPCGCRAGRGGCRGHRLALLGCLAH